MLFGPSECYFSASIGEFHVFEPFLHVFEPFLRILTLIGAFAVVFMSLAMLCVPVRTLDVFVQFPQPLVSSVLSCSL